MSMLRIFPAAALITALAVSAGAQQRKLDPTTFIVIGEGLAAGMADFSLKDVYQEKSFPAQMAEQMDVAMPQPLFEGSGVGNVPGFPPLPVRYPGPGQGSVRKDFPPTLFIFNLSVPGFRLSDSFAQRPSAPLIQAQDMQKTITNLTLGYPALILPNKPLWNQLEYAQSMNPSMVMVAMGYFDVLDAAVNNDLTRLTDPAVFRTNYASLLNNLRKNGAEVIAATVPNPLDTGFFTTPQGALRLVPTDLATLTRRYSLRADDLITIPALQAMANQVRWNEPAQLPANSVMSAATQAAITANVTALNAAITAAAQAAGAQVYDMNALFRRVRTSGLLAGKYALTADYLGGFYSLDGYYPAWTGNAAIANDVLSFLNQTYGQTFPLISLAAISPNDPAIRHSLNFARIVPPVQP